LSVSMCSGTSDLTTAPLSYFPPPENMPMARNFR